MQQIVSITSQGQITIPASMRRELNIEKYKKASVRSEKGKIIIEPTVDLLNLGGLLKDKAIKDKKINEVIKLEDKALIISIGKKYLSKNEKIHR